MSSYISADFEKTYLSTSEQVRVIVRSRDDGDVPPDPSATYFPTDPDLLENFIVAEYVSDAIGERFARVAALADLSSLDVLPLIDFKDTSVDFVAAGVSVGDVLEITLADSQIWTSSEYPTGNPFYFTVSSVVSSTVIRVSPEFPSFMSGVSWEVPAQSLSGLAGVTHRQGSPVGPVEILERRFNNYFSSAASADAFVTATKASMRSLATDDTVASLIDETFTASSTV